MQTHVGAPGPVPGTAARPPRPAKQPANRVVTWEARIPQPRGDSGLENEGLRVWEALQQLQPELFPSISAAKRAIRRGLIIVDGVPAASPSSTLRGGELVQCMERQGGMEQLPAGGPLGTKHSGGAGAGAAILPLEVVHEDDYMACIVKPPGTPVDSPPGRGGGSGAPSSSTESSSDTGGAPPPAAPSVYSRLARTLAPSGQVGALRRPRHCHRLDEPTGGLLLVGKTQRAHAALCEAFRERQVTKRYRALAWGRLDGRGRISWDLDKRPCDTEYQAVQHTTIDLSCLGMEGMPCSGEQSSSGGGGGTSSGGRTAWVTTVDLWPHTGRYHQLRRHMALLGHPLVGDPKYTFGYAAARLAAGRGLLPEGHQRLPNGTAGAAARVTSGTAGGEDDAAGVKFAGDLPAVARAATARHGLKLCLWAVELNLEQHPADSRPMHFCIPEPPEFASVRAALAGTAGM